jgi:hypothetical protein
MFKKLYAVVVLSSMVSVNAQPPIPCEYGSGYPIGGSYDYPSSSFPSGSCGVHSRNLNSSESVTDSGYGTPTQGGFARPAVSPTQAAAALAAKATADTTDKK